MNKGIVRWTVEMELKWEGGTIMVFKAGDGIGGFLSQWKSWRH